MVELGKYLNKDEYRSLLLAALPTANDADTLRPELNSLFTPTTHRNALDPDVTVVRGARGVGKTVWYTALQDRDLRALASEIYQIPRLNSSRALAGYGSELRPDDYPGPATLARLLRDGIDPDDVWGAVIVSALGTWEGFGAASWPDRVRMVRNDPEKLDMAIAVADKESGRQGITTLVLFDALDRLHSERRVAERLVEGILRLALDLRTRTRNIRAKVFIRHDMFDGVKLQFPDASKLTANAADLTWTATNLYGLLFHRLGNAPSELSSHFRRDTGRRWREWTDRFEPPPDLIGDSKRQQPVFERIAGEYMGTDHRKGRPYTWLPNHLVDGIGQVSPRSFLSALRRATDVTMDRYARHDRALHWDGIRQGVQAASRIRVDEVNEDLPWVAAAVAVLEGLQVPMELETVTSRWTSVGLPNDLRNGENLSEETENQVRTGPRNIDDLPALVKELVELGVMSRRADGRVDLPDVYRIAFKIGRKGGVPRLKQ